MLHLELVGIWQINRSTIRGAGLGTAARLHGCGVVSPLSSVLPNSTLAMDPATTHAALMSLPP